MARLTAMQLRTMLESPWFGRLPEPARGEVLESARLRALADGEMLYEKDRAADAWYGIVEGAVRLGASTCDGRQGLLTFLEPGNWFGDTSLFDGMPRPHDAVAHGATLLLVLPAARFFELLDRYPVLYRHFVLLFCQRTRLLFVAMEATAAFPLEERLALYLVNLANGHGLREGEDIVIRLHLPQEHLAQLLGVTRQRISQILRDWERHGWLRYRYGRIVLRAAWLAGRGAGVLALAVRDDRMAAAP
jgi:CRP-like cAMP-binding protein